MTLTRTPVRRARTRLAAAITAAAAVAALGAASPSLASADAGTIVSGSGVRSASSAGDVPFTFSVRAIAPAPPDQVYGTFYGSFPHDAPFPAPGNFATFHGAVTCLRVSGDQATIGGVVISGYGYDDTYTQGHRDLTGDWFITTVRDPAETGSPDTMGYIDWGDRSYFASQGFSSFASLCDNPASDLGTAQFPLSSGDIKISD